MNHSVTTLSFQCPQKWEGMIPQGDGRLCSSCKKIVTDFTKIPLTALNAVPTAPAGVHACGHYHAYQLHKPFNNGKDKLISFYQRIALGKSIHRYMRPLALLLMMMVLVATGCHRRLAGVRAYQASTKKHNKPYTSLTGMPAGEKK